MTKLGASGHLSISGGVLLTLEQLLEVSVLTWAQPAVTAARIVAARIVDRGCSCRCLSPCSSKCAMPGVVLLAAHLKLAGVTNVALGVLFDLSLLGHFVRRLERVRRVYLQH